MTDSTWMGVAGIVAIVAITGIFFGLQGGAGITGAATSEAASARGEIHADGTCDPGRFCDGSRLVIVREDCSIAESFCQRGCNREALVCN